MAIGLHDADMSVYKQLVPNLELMKKAAYYKQHNQITVLTNNFQPIQYEKYIYQKDYNDGLFPRKIMSYGNVEIDGLAFSNNKYRPMSIEKEEIIPDKSIYDTARHMFEKDKNKLKLFDRVLKMQHLRLSLDGKTVWKNFYKQLSEIDGQNFMFHDVDLNKIEGATDIIKKLVKNCKAVGTGYISTKFPINVYSDEDLLKWLDLKWSADFFTINYYGIMSTETLKKVLNYKAKLGKIQYIVTYGYKNEQDFVDNGIEKIYEQFILACSNRQQISLKYEDNFFENKEWEQFFLLLEIFKNATLRIRKENFEKYRKNNTLFRFVKNLKLIKRHHYSLTKDEARHLFAFIRDKNFSLFCKFYEQGLTEKLEE